MLKQEERGKGKSFFTFFVISQKTYVIEKRKLLLKIRKRKLSKFTTNLFIFILITISFTLLEIFEDENLKKW